MLEISRTSRQDNLLLADCTSVNNIFSDHPEGGYSLYWNDETLEVVPYEGNEKVYYCGKELKLYDNSNRSVIHTILSIDTQECICVDVWSDGEMRVLFHKTSFIDNKHRKGGQSAARAFATRCSDTGRPVPSCWAQRLTRSTSSIQFRELAGAGCVSIDSTDDGDSLEILGNPNAPAEILEVDNDNTLNIANASAAAGNAVVVGGTLDIVLAEGYSASNAAPPSIGLFGPLTPAAFTDVVINEFDPADQSTYNHATSMKIYDSLGNPHVLTQYFVRQEYDVNDPTTHPNHWVMYVQIDGRDVGDPDTTLPPPENTLPTRAGFDVRFNEDGSLNQIFSDQVLVSNWTPLDPDGNPNGALGPQNVLAGGSVTIPDPPTNSNFVIDLAGTTQFGSVFSVNDVDQNGYTTGRLSGLNIDETGVIFARFTNGESQVLGQVILADFANNQGLQPVGESMWAENYESGPPNIGTPGSAALGAIQAGALEESNVDLSEELVRLIIAQRNFQASAKTIETANQVTQTVINLR